MFVDYEIFAAFWPHASEAEGAKPLNDARKHVASRTLSGPLEWENSILIEGDEHQFVADGRNGVHLRVGRVCSIEDQGEAVHLP